ncbi:MAG: phosphotransferase [Pseudomonadales bacterium]
MDAAFRQWVDRRLAELGGSAGAWEPLPAEASHRRFYRVRVIDAVSTPSVVAMTSPPDLERNDAFEHLAGVFLAAGIGVPEIHAIDRGRGYLLLSDLGGHHLIDAYRQPGAEAVLPAAIDTLIRLQQVSDPGITPYTRQRFQDELAIYRQWCLDALLALPAPAGLDAAFALLVDATDAQPRCCVHRDFHSRNLLLGGDGGIGVVDFQDALIGPATYDLASLLRDCYHRFEEAEVARWRDHYLARTPLPVDRATFARDLDFVALQRQLKAVGIFARLKLRDGRDTHLAHIVPVLARIRDLAAAHPPLAALAEHAAAAVPLARQRLAAAA